MYLEHFGLREMPFAITPGAGFVFASRAHQEALNTLLIATQGGEGFVMISGEVGTGKTILCRRFLDILHQHDVVTAYIPNPALQPQTLLRALATELGVGNTAGLDEYSLLASINDALVDVAVRGSSVVVCLDEAQALPQETLEAVRLLSNLETDRSKLLQLVLFGQPELLRTLAEPSLRQLRQRITFEYQLSGMSLRELDRYVAHRLGVAGYAGPELFSSAAIQRLFLATEGIPRLVNILCHKALLGVFGEGGHVVLPSHVRAAAADTASVQRPSYLPLWLTRHGQWAERALKWMRP